MTGKNKGLDERQQKLMDKAMALSGIVGFLYGILMILYKFYRTGNLKSSYIQIGLVSIMFIIMLSYFIISGEHDSSIDKDKKKIKFAKSLDERQRKRITVSLGIGGFTAFVYSFFIIALTLLKTRKLESAYSEITLIVIMGLIVILYNVLNKEYDIPRTFLGTTLSLSNSKEHKRFRLIHYAKDAIKLGLFFLVLDIMNPDRVIIPFPSRGSKILSYALNSFLTMIIFFTLNYLWGEYNVKKRRKFDESLEDDEDNY